ncbi:MAG: hypothetical protein UW08_C0020G0010 [Parcubacteria group bacterium GW2011_GWB1_43_8b]|nr:MAG: hypothetical protein UW08_C0020G0010 [Parcubacteria group bacterium GW2011_GWB1_43_8b]
MKNILLIAFAIIVAAGVGWGIYSLTQNKNADIETGGPVDVTGPESNNAYIGDDFTIVPPPNWIETHLPGTLVSFQNSKETHPLNSAAAKINFKSYIAVSFDNANGKTANETAELIKQQTINILPNISFSPATDRLIDGQPAKFMEASISQQNVNFKVMIVVALKGDKFFTISYNTTAEKWTEYRNLFYSTADSFKFKY